MNFKDLITIGKELFGTAVYAAGLVAVVLFLMSLYPPLSFITKFFILFTLTH